MFGIWWHDGTERSVPRVDPKLRLLPVRNGGACFSTSPHGLSPGSLICSQLTKTPQLVEYTESVSGVNACMSDRLTSRPKAYCTPICSHGRETVCCRPEGTNRKRDFQVNNWLVTGVKGKKTQTFPGEQGSQQATMQSEQFRRKTDENLPILFTHTHTFTWRRKSSI